jgi:Ca-activated chloride channel homolog
MTLKYMLVVFAILIVACGSSPRPTVTTTVPIPNPTDFRIIAGSEVKTLEDAGIFRDFTKQSGINLNIRYKGSVDIKNLVNAYAVKNPGDVDAFWPASPIWLPGTFVQNKSSVMRTYVVLGVDPQVATTLGWNQKNITAEDVIAAIKSGQIKLAMPSATQDDAGAIFYLSALSWLKGGDQVLTPADLANPTITEEIRTLLNGVSRSAASSDALKNVFVQDRLGAKQYNAIVWPESLAIDANRELVSKNAQPMQIFYVNGATGLETFPIGYSDKSSQAKIDQFNALLSFLKSPDIQKRLNQLGWRTGYVGMAVENADPAVFNQSWGIDPQKEVQPITLPKEAVIDQALNTYLLVFKKPAYTQICIDDSGSMAGEGKNQVQDATDLLLDQNRAATVLLQASESDFLAIKMFDNNVVTVGTVSGNNPTRLKDLSKKVANTTLGGGTALFDCVRAALDEISKNYQPDQYNYTVIAMTDGRSNRGMSQRDFEAYYKANKFTVPVFGIAFGDADDSQMKTFITTTNGEICDGRSGGEALLLCFRKAKGSN